MAAAEARAVWQRAANRCFVQEDAKRAPKLACCPSSSSSKPQVDGGSGDAAHGTENSTGGFVPLNWNTSNSNLPPDTKWWLHLQPNLVQQKDFTREHLNSLDIELEMLRAEEVNQASRFDEDDADPPTHEEESTQMGSSKKGWSSLDPRFGMFTACMKHEFEDAKQELKAANSEKTQQPLKRKSMNEHWYGDKDLEVDQLISKEIKRFSDWEFPWNGGEKTEPWWRTADKDELASLVAQKSLEHIENCDLPPPQAMHVRRGPFACLECFEQDRILPSSLACKAMSGVYAGACHTCGSQNGKQWGTGEKGHFYYGSDKPISSSGTNSQSSTSKDSPETQHRSTNEPSKAELLEALRHSQTRAREAEKAAQEAYNEKEHIVKLFFRQASHLFAYKQWLQLLQLETLCLQLKNKEQQISTLFPVLLPWMPCRARQWKKSKHKGKKDKRGRPIYDIGRYAVVFALGIGLAGAGFLLGWTIGWLLPMF